MNSRNRQKIKRISAKLLLAAVILAIMSPGMVFALTETYSDEEAALAAALYTLNAETEAFRQARRPGLRIPLGNVSGDGVVTYLDLLLLRLYLAGHDVEILRQAADINADGRISAIDLMLLRLYLAGHPAISNE